MGNRIEPQRAVKLDGRKGEGGGQLVRVAITLAAITGTPIVIENVRANRERGGRGGGKHFGPCSVVFPSFPGTPNDCKQVGKIKCVLIDCPSLFCAIVAIFKTLYDDHTVQGNSTSIIRAEKLY